MQSILDEIKRSLLDDPKQIVSILEYFGFANITQNQSEIRCGRDAAGNRSAIRIRLTHNDHLFVNDYARNRTVDLFATIMHEKGVTFREILQYVREATGCDSFTYKPKKYQVFGGAYNGVYLRRKRENFNKPINENVLNQYEPYGCLRFLRDGISIETQRKFGVKYDVDSQRIVIPIYSPAGELIGAKGRANWDVSEDEPKYMYLVPCQVRYTLYGYAQNYASLIHNRIYVFEAEKSVMQCDSFGVHNAVALGGNAVHDEQCKLLMELQPTEIVFMLDSGLDLSVTRDNIARLKKFVVMQDTKIGYWDYNSNITLPDKSSPSDGGQEEFENIIESEIEWVKG